MIDPFQRRFGTRWGGILFFPALLGEICWSAAVLNALGATLSVVLGIDTKTSIIISGTVFYPIRPKGGQF